ncbi:MAG: response regulator transcription factor [Eubacteriales bacterium]|jgi:DNA-binding response OmpR family regulator|nr:response regulator transcription factor [Lachnospiraceae bacterium]MDD5859602.1 response regulator transcription factor [Eubacteriales bacterium]MCH4063303.1 response regulator transcription factor [Lachnospiraceae bacterium]MCH4104454.1 response regulator transcription factor [Lachnospiraceae bacterium]MCI1309265.1 response regulator transcription factor [Lachnospiraceae bacterium]
MKLLLAEDTRDLNRALCAVLRHEQYDVDPVFDGEDALEHIRRDSYDAIILDIMMPKRSGLNVLKEIRAINIVTPVLLLTAKAEIDDRVSGLDAGADDYLTKPFAMKELLARIRSMTRRRTEYSAKELHFQDLVLSAERFELASQNSVRLSIKEFELMQTLILNAGKDLDTKYLLDHVWSGEPDANEDTVWLYINYLRAKLTSIDSSASISGARGGSYRLEVGH